MGTATPKSELTQKTTNRETHHVGPQAPPSKPGMNNLCPGRTLNQSCSDWRCAPQHWLAYCSFPLGARTSGHLKNKVALHKVAPHPSAPTRRTHINSKIHHSDEQLQGVRNYTHIQKQMFARLGLVQHQLRYFKLGRLPFAKKKGRITPKQKHSG